MPVEPDDYADFPEPPEDPIRSDPEPASVMTLDEAFRAVGALEKERRSFQSYLESMTEEAQAAALLLSMEEKCDSVEEFAILLVKRALSERRMRDTSAQGARRIRTDDHVTRRYGLQIMQAFVNARPDDQWVTCDTKSGSVRSCPKHPGSRAGLLTFEIRNEEEKAEWKDLDGNVTEQSVRDYLLGFARRRST